jgi:hypothetical protein
MRPSLLQVEESDGHKPVSKTEWRFSLCELPTLDARGAWDERETRGNIYFGNLPWCNASGPLNSLCLYKGLRPYLSAIDATFVGDGLKPGDTNKLDVTRESTTPELRLPQ